MSIPLLQLRQGSSLTGQSLLSIRRKSIQILPAPQPNRVLIDKPTRIRVIVPEEVVMQPRLRIAILVLQPERLVRAGNIRLAVESAPAVVVAEPQQAALRIGHLARDADLVAVEVVDFLIGLESGIGVVVDLRQWFVAVLVGIDVGIPAVGVHFL